MMKKLIAVFLCLLMVLALFSCDGKIPSEKEESQTTESGENQNKGSGNHSSDKSSSKDKLSQQKLAEQAYEAVLKNELPIIQENGQKIYLQECVFIGGYTRLDEVEALQKAVIDMDGDGIDEFLIRESGYHGAVILFRYYEGDVYSFTFDGDAMFSIKTDGSFRWEYYNSYDRRNEEGESHIVFDGANLILCENWRIENYSKYFINGEQVTEEELDEHLFTSKTELEYNVFVLDRSTWDVGKALAYASEHWGISDGDFEAETGYRYRLIAEYYQGNYRVFLKKLVKNQSYITVDEILVDISTGEILPTPDGKG